MTIDTVARVASTCQEAMQVAVPGLPAEAQSAASNHASALGVEGRGVHEPRK